MKGMQQHCMSVTFFLVRDKYLPTSTSCQFKGSKHFGLKEIHKEGPADGDAERLPWSAGVFWNAGIPARPALQDLMQQGKGCNKRSVRCYTDLDIYGWKERLQKQRPGSRLSPGLVQLMWRSLLLPLLPSPPQHSTVLVSSFSSHPYFNNMAKWRYFFLAYLCCFAFWLPSKHHSSCTNPALSVLFFSLHTRFVEPSRPLL